MPVKIPLTPLPSKTNPFYPILLAHPPSPPHPPIIHQLATYNPPHLNPPQLKIHQQLALKSLHDGPKPTHTLHNILSTQAIFKKFHQQNNPK
nr:30S ribosomal protein S16 [Staphylococcus epidermidis]